TSARTLSVALTLPPDTSELRTGAVRVLNEFLNYIRPGRTALWESKSEIPEQIWFTAALPTVPSRPAVFFRDGFFFSGMVERIASGAARTLGDALRTTDFTPVTERLTPAAQWALKRIEFNHGVAPP